MTSGANVIIYVILGLSLMLAITMYIVYEVPGNWTVPRSETVSTDTHRFDCDKGVCNVSFSSLKENDYQSSGASSNSKTGSQEAIGELK